MVFGQRPPPPTMGNLSRGTPQRICLSLNELRSPFFLLLLDHREHLWQLLCVTLRPAALRVSYSS